MAKQRLRRESACKCSICEVEGPSAKKAEVPVSASSQMARLLGSLAWQVCSAAMNSCYKKYSASALGGVPAGAVEVCSLLI